MPTITDKLRLNSFAPQAEGGFCISASHDYVIGKKKNTKPNTAYDLEVQWSGKNKEHNKNNKLLVVTVNPFPPDEEIVYGLAGRIYILTQDGAVHISDMRGNPINTMEVANRIGVHLMGRMPQLKGELVDPVIKAIFERYYDGNLIWAGQSGPGKECIEAIVETHDYAIVNGIYAERCRDNLIWGQIIISCLGVGTYRCAERR